MTPIQACNPNYGRDLSVQSDVEDKRIRETGSDPATVKMDEGIADILSIQSFEKEKSTTSNSLSLASIDESDKKTPSETDPDAETVKMDEGVSDMFSIQSLEKEKGPASNSSKLVERDEVDKKMPSETGSDPAIVMMDEGSSDILQILSLGEESLKADDSTLRKLDEVKEDEITSSSQTQLQSLDSILDVTAWLKNKEEVFLPQLKEGKLTLDEATRVFQDIKDVYKQTNRVESTDGLNERLNQLMTKVEPILNDMNNSATYFTRRDAQMFQVFTQPPIEKWYIDELDQKRYALANHSELLGVGTEFVSKHKCYKGIEVSLHKRTRNFLNIHVTLQNGDFSPVYDAIFFKKSEWQVSAEEGALSIMPNLFNFEENQKKLRADIYLHLLNNYRRWGYSGFCLLSTKEEMSMIDLPKESTSKYHAVILFLKPDKPSQKELVCPL